MNNQNLYKQIPSVDEIIKNLSPSLSLLPKKLIKLIIRDSIKNIKKQISNKIINENIGQYLNDLILKKLEEINKPHLNKVINGTGIILHTGLGRAPISKKNI